ncbi:hypothetical protein HMSSN036_74500 [Paenibacillus macerans]|nr:hypothetical protein HMSSN036_74500 [Paenibacillus macerans]
MGGVSFGRFLWNSTVVAVIGTLGGVMSSLMAAYAFARVRFALSSFWFVCVMTTLMIPNQVMIVPQYILFKRLHFIDTLTSLIIPWFFGSAFFIFLMVQFIRGLPLDLDEAAEIDGSANGHFLPHCVAAGHAGYYYFDDFLVLLDLAGFLPAFNFYQFRPACLRFRWH